ncbi:hypothetical protein BgiBS90_014020, partial [Biomphalaria glabrata]
MLQETSLTEILNKQSILLPSKKKPPQHKCSIDRNNGWNISSLQQNITSSMSIRSTRKSKLK